MNYKEALHKIQEHLETYFQSQKDKTFHYHNLDHTQHVVRAAKQIARHYELPERDEFIVITASWFHDSGYFEDFNSHESKGAEMAGTYLTQLGFADDLVAAVAGCIRATHLPQNPTNRLEEIVCDADLFHLGTEDFPRFNKLMRKEAEAKKGISISKDDWRKGTIKLFETHHYFTAYCQALLNGKKNDNLQKLRTKAAKKETKSAITQTPAAPVADSSVISEGNVTVADKPPVAPLLTMPGAAQAKKKKDEKAGRPDRGIETMFRITSGNNQRLSDMADNKAHIMITVNSIILSAIISLLLRKLEEYDFLRWPTYLILAVSVLAIIFSILATRPNLPSGRFTQEEIDDKKVNLLFFGNFYRMNLNEYTQGMLQMMADRDFLYGTLIKDVYSQGVVLGRKYRLLRISYSIFMYGLIISVMAFVAATIIAGK